MKIINHNIPIITIIAPRKSAFSWFSLGGVAVFNPITPLWIFRVLSHHCLACVKIPVTEDALHFFNHPKPQMGLKKYSASYILYTLYIYINYNYIYIMYNMVYQFIISWITRNFTIFQTEIAILCFFFATRCVPMPLGPSPWLRAIAAGRSRSFCDRYANIVFQWAINKC